MAAEGADFFLRFGSDAGAFSKDLSKDLSSGVAQINSLSEALLRYDRAVADVKGSGNPLGNISSSLGQAGAKLDSISSQISGEFSKIVSSLGTLSSELKSTLEALKRGQSEVGGGARPVSRPASGLAAARPAPAAAAEESPIRASRIGGPPDERQAARARLLDGASGGAQSAAEATANAQQLVRQNDFVADSYGRVREAMLREFAAQEKLNAQKASAGERGGATPAQIGETEATLAGRVRATDTARASQSRAEEAARAPVVQPVDGAANQIRLNDYLGASYGRVREALTQLFKAEERLKALRDSGEGTATQLGNAEREESVARRGVTSAQQAQAPPTAQQRLFGQGGFAENQIRHVGRGLETVVAYSIVFTGLDKLKELAHAGIQTQVEFVRLQASLDANGIAAGNLQTKLQGVASSTAQPVEQVIEAAAGMAGVFNNIGDIAFGTKMAAQLANISQGTLNVKDAARGLIDVYTAYGLTGQAALQGVNDEIAHLSQVTGVNVKDITQGTTQIAQEAAQVGLSQHQASTLAAYVSRGTGLPGEQSAAQTTRIFGNITKPKAEETLIRTGVATRAQFLSGDLPGVMDNLIKKYKTLSPAQQAAIRDTVADGQSQRAFAAIVGISADGLSEYRGKLVATGAAARQNTSVLNTIAGAVKQLDEDFQSLGSNLTRLGAFDFIGGLAKAMDLLLKAVNATFGRIADIMDASPFTKVMSHIAVTILEVVAAFKLLGGVAAPMLARAFPRVGAFQATNAAAIATRAREMEAPGGGGLTPVEPRYRQLTLGRTLGGVRGVAAGGFGLAARGRAAEDSARAAFAQESLNTQARGRGALGVPFGPVTQGVSVVEAARAAEAGRLAPPETGTNRLTRLGRTLGGGQDTGRIVSGLGTAAERTGQSLTGLRTGMSSMASTAKSAIGGLGGLNIAMIAVTVGIAFLSEVMAGAAKQAKSNADIIALIQGPGPGKKDKGGKPELTRLQQDVQGAGGRNLAQQAVGLIPSIGGIGNRFGLGSSLPGSDKVGGLQHASGKSKREADQLGQDVQAKLDAAYATKDASKIEAASAAADTEIKDKQSQIARSGHNSVKAQAEINAQIAGIQSDALDAADGRIKAAKGFANLDQITYDQALAIPKLLQDSMSLTGETIKANPAAVKGMLDQAYILAGNKPGAAALKAAGIGEDAKGNATAVAGSTTSSRLKGDIDLAQQNIDNAQATLDSTTSLAKATKHDPDAENKLRDAIKQSLDIRQGAIESLRDNAIATATALSGAQETGGDYTGAVSSLKSVEKGLEDKLAATDRSDPQFYALLGQIQDTKNKIADVTAENANLGLEIAGSTLTDPVAKLQNAQQIAQNLLDSIPKTRAPRTTQVLPSRAGGALSDTIASATTPVTTASGPLINTQKRKDAIIAANQAAIGTRQGQESLAEAQAAAAAAPVRNTTAAAQLQLNETLRQESVYSSAGSKNDEKLAGLKATEAQNRIAIADATNADAQSMFDVTAAQQTLHGNDLGAAQTNLAKATQAYQYAVSQGEGPAQTGGALAAIFQAQAAVNAQILTTSGSFFDLVIAQRTNRGDSLGAANETLAKAKDAYRLTVANTGAGSVASRTAYIQVLNDTKAAIDAALASQNSGLDLQIAQLNARGKSGDAQKAAADQTKQAQNAIAAYRKRGGKTGTPEMNALQSTLVSAQRNAFDVALNAQLDTLDFQVQTYKITSAGEVKALQVILKNKHLTLAEQRKITLQIKDLQTSIREQLTQGGLNIPSDIKLPTAYEVRRSLGAGFAGSATHAATSQVNNNQHVTTTINQVLPNAAVATAVANQVISIINQQTGQQVRANSATPRLVKTG